MSGDKQSVVDNPHSKYVLFRNYMMNELGISREDIKQWTKEAVEDHAARIIAQINIQGIVEKAAAQAANSQGPGIRQAVAEQVAKRIKMTVENPL